MTTAKIKSSTEKFLKKNKIPINKKLPLIEDIEEVNPLNSNIIAKKLCALSYIIGLGYDAPPNEMKALIDQYRLDEVLSDYEKTLLNSKKLSKQDKINCTWLDEAAQALAWSLSMVKLDNFTHCDDDLADKIPFKSSPDEFIETAQVRPIDEIQMMVDQLYRMHWYAKYCRNEDKECPYSESIIRERRRALDWVYGVEINWDEVPSDI